MKKIIFGLIILTISCNEKPKSEFSLSGSTNGIENGTVLYLDDNSSENNLIDSAIVNNNSFNFQTKLLKTPLQVALRTKTYSHYRFLWLENNSMKFDGTQTDFRNANVTGSKSESLIHNLHKEIDSLSKEEQINKAIEFVKNNPNSIVSASMLSIYSTTWGKEKTSELFNKFSEENKNSEYGKSISKYIELNKNPKIGEKYVDFKMTDTNGKII